MSSEVRQMVQGTQTATAEAADQAAVRAHGQRRKLPGRFGTSGARALARAVQPLRRLGPWAGVGLGLGALAAMLCLVVLVPAVRQTAALEQSLAQLPTDGGAASPAMAVDSPKAFLSRLPTTAELPAILSTFVAQSEAAQIELHDGHYEMVEAKQGAAARYRLTLPVNGSYPNVRKFIDGTLAAVPSAALDSISLQREDIKSASVDADLTFVVFLRDRR